MTTNASGTAIYAASQAITATVNANSDNVQLEALPSKGPAENAGRMDRGEAAIGQFTDWVKSQVQQGNDPYGDLSYSPQQLFSVYVVPWIIVTNNPDIKTITDISSDTNIVIGPSGYGTYELFTRALELYDVTDYTVKDVQYPEQASAFSDDRIDVGLTNILNPPIDRAIEPGWVQEIKATTDELGVIHWPDGGDRLVEDDVIETHEWDVGAYDQEYASSPGYNLYEPQNPYTSVTENYNFVARDDVPRDLIYDMLTTMHDQVDTLGEQHALLEFYKEDDVWVLGAWDDLDFHPGAADFYEELGVWKDEWSRGE
jgi:TRAP transporter TAXI family solute receptor